MQTASKKVINGWAMYDWANSTYSLVITSTIFPSYYTAIAPKQVDIFGRIFDRDALASYTIALSFLVIAILSPVLSSIADYKGNKKSFMKFFCYFGSAACCGLLFFTKDHILLGLFLSILASIGFCGSIVFYNAYLPEIAEEKDQDRVSARGFAMGYIGSVILMVLNLAAIMANDKLKLGWGAWPVRLSFLSVGLWWAGFAQIAFRVLPASQPSSQRPEHSILVNGFYELKKVWQQLTHYPVLKRFLRSFFFYNMGVQTVMYMATYFAADEIGMKSDQLITTILIIQLVAIFGAYLFSLLSKKTNNIFTLAVLVLCWTGICIYAFFTLTPNDFYILAFCVGMIMGGIQSMSRSTYSKLLPETKDTASYFSFFDVCDKIGTVIGTLSFGFVAELSHGMRNSVLALASYFIIGFVLLMFVRMKIIKWYRLVKLFTINTGLFKLDGGAMFGVVPKSMWSKLNPPDENNLCTWAMRCLLIEDKNRLILIDTGIGNKQSEKFLSHYHLHGNDTLPTSLAKHGFNKKDITDVILTHLHFDHVGGAVERVGDRLELTFPNANYWSNEEHWQWATEPNAREKASFLKENIQPLKESGRLYFIDPLHAAFSPSIDILFANGHTKAMMLPVIHYAGRKIVFMADLLPSAAHLPLPYVMAYDMFPLITLEEKERFLAEALANDYVLFFEHDPAIECCTLQQTEKGIRVKETFALADIIIG